MRRRDEFRLSATSAGMDIALLGLITLPELEHPLPETVGLNLPFTIAGWGALLGSMFEGPRERRRPTTTQKWAIRGFLAGWLLLLPVIGAEVI